MRSPLLLLGMAAFLTNCYFEVPPTSGDPAHSLAFAERLTQQYDAYRHPAVNQRRFTIAQLQPALAALDENFTLTVAGRSVEDRPVNRVAWGAGPIQVLLWSQMHGDEPTATGALLDIFNWLATENDGMDSIRERLSQRLTLTFLPMLNPDGAEKFQRRNALGIDLNRDARRLQSPEARVLKEERDRLNADWGFNLHDQSRYYGVGFPPQRMAGLSILAPAYDWEKSVNSKRGEAMQLIALMNRSWQRNIPGGVGRYNDDFEPRAFGDNLQAWGTRTILIESGGEPGDREKQGLRKLNFVGILAALHAIAGESFRGVGQEEYWAIPENSSGAIHDLLLREVYVNRGSERHLIDVGFRQSERWFEAEGYPYYLSGRISDLGDLHTFGAYREIGGEQRTVEAGKVYPQTVRADQIGGVVNRDFYEKGYTALRVADFKPELSVDFTGARLISSASLPDTTLAPGHSTDLVLYRDGKAEAAVINGHWIQW